MNQLSETNILPVEKLPKTAKGRRTLLKILEAAEQEFGERGYHEASITRITLRAEVAMGTFYVYFSSKEEIFRALVSHMSGLTRKWISERISDAPDRLTAEQMGIEAYLEFARLHKNLYQIVNESQFVAPDAFEAHYNGFVEAYTRNLRSAEERGEISPGNAEQRAWALIGISVFLGLRYAIWDDSKPLSEVAKGAQDIIRHGLKPRDLKS